MRTLVLDTNFLLLPFQFKIDIFRELEYVLGEPFQLVIPSGVISELNGISKRVGKSGAAARLALKLVEANRKIVEVAETDSPVDDWVFTYAKENKAIACTNDAGLKGRLRAEKMKVIGLRSKTKLGYV